MPLLTEIFAGAGLPKGQLRSFTQNPVIWARVLNAEWDCLKWYSLRAQMLLICAWRLLFIAELLLIFAILIKTTLSK